jgi:signal transduction histidine kinase
MRLTDFIEQQRTKIIDDWVKFAATLLPWANGMSDSGLRDHADELLSAVIGDMKSPQSKAERSEKSKGKAAEGTLGRVGQRHASDRLVSGFNLDQLVSEYRALRASVLRLWEAEHGDSDGEVTRFNEAIDETLTESTARYSETVNNTREQFLAVLGHDLRNPLTSIVMGTAHLTSSKNLDDKESRIALRVLNSAQRMSRMVSDLLDLTRTRLGAGIPVVPKPMDLSVICQQVISEFEGSHPDRAFRFEAKGDLRGEWDSDRLMQVISNLVANAVQYGAENGVVTLAAEENGEEIELRVHNRGTPIPERMIEKIFEPMVRRQPPGDRNVTGLGLGLYIAREIVTAHGGTLEVTSTEEEGTTFTIHVPRAASSRQEHTRPNATPLEQQASAAEPL